MSNPTVVFDPYASADLCNSVQTIVDNYNVAITGQADWYPVAFLDTFSFQARPFYEKLGYHVFGMLENHPAGHQHYFMTKQLQV
jgi:hypothetical protein